jgi:hypothetical protein
MPHPSAPVFALFLGQALILFAVSDNWRSGIFTSPPIGMPFSEAWVDMAWRPVLAAMRMTLRDGVGREVVMAHGRVVVSPHYDTASRLAGVVLGTWPLTGQAVPDGGPRRPGQPVRRRVRRHGVSAA